MACATDSKLSLLSMNVRGLRNAKKRRALFFSLKKGNYDIIGLQETHLTKADKEILSKEWGPNFYISEGSSNSKGLVLLFGKSIQFDDTSLLLENNRCLITLINSAGIKLLIANVYAPCTYSEKSKFLFNLKSYIESNTSKYNINDSVIFGDFNIVKCNEKDIISGNPHSLETVSEFNMFINDLQLIDIWREHNNNVRDFTWSSRSPFTARRLDYIFVSPNLFPFCYDPSIKTIGFSDHRAVTLIVDFASFKRGPGTFKFNSQLLHNQDFVNDVKKEICKISSMDLDPHLKWENIKIHIKNLAMTFGKSIAIQKRKKKIYITNLRKQKKRLLNLQRINFSMRDISL